MLRVSTCRRRSCVKGGVHLHVAVAVNVVVHDHDHVNG